MTDTKHDDGGPAYPEVYPDGRIQGGPTLLDWFAGQALAGLAAGESNETGHYASDEARCESAYDIAAAMIAEKRRREAMR